MSPAKVIQGDCLVEMQTLETASFDAVIADPPYCSGGFTRADRMRDPAEKYVQKGTKIKRRSFLGDNRDARSFAFWSHLWLSHSYRLVRDGGYCLVFTDWRQLPLVTDVIQSAGWVWRGIIAWDKGEGARAPHKGYFRHQCEYVVWASKGGLPIAVHDGPYPGCIRATVKQSDKHHITGKPTELMRQLARPIVPGGRILDPFAGSGTTGVGAVLEGREFFGIDLDAENVELANRRLSDAWDRRLAA